MTVTGAGSQWSIPGGTFLSAFWARARSTSKTAGASLQEPAQSWPTAPHRPARSTSVAVAYWKLNPCGVDPARARPISTMVSCRRRPATRPSSTDFQAPGSTSSRAG
ncbi:hypothetical protein [Bradyrhizobium japonicum]|uniref:hypothetical protein n=1 Tax=Bradyrhizobium japonicum TaxID=375 RepID=UPI001FCB9777|nr:hypothetical protein [Bradyrhizobium japonicum]